MVQQHKQFVIDDLSMQESWRLFKIMAELVDGFDTLGDYGHGVSIFGSARVRDGDPIYDECVEIAQKLAEAGYTVITGGGPGIMEAGNKGAAQVEGGVSVGLNIRLPMEQKPNDFQNVALDFKYFFVRKVMFVKYATAYIVMPGGLGTLDELFEATVLVQTKRIKPFPIILYKSEYWSGLVDWIRDRMVQAGYLNEEELDLFAMMDSPDEVVHFIKRYVIV